MKSEDIQNFRKILEESTRYSIPVYQRYYKWGPKHWNRLWDSFLKLRESLKLRRTLKHYMGSIVGYQQEGLDWVTIDGQQRLITLCLVFAAIRDIIQDPGEANTIHTRYLQNSKKQFKVRPRGSGGPSPNDQVAFERILGTPCIDVDDIDAGRVKEAYVYFKKKFSNLVSSESEEALQDLYNTLLENLSMVKITLDEDDNPHAIFETLNDTGDRITQADCVRNFLFLKVPKEGHDQVRERWEPIETSFRELSENQKQDLLTDFCHDFAMMRQQTYFPESELYFRVQAMIQKDIDSRMGHESYAQSALNAVLDFIQELSLASRAYVQVIRPTTEEDREVRDALHVVHEISSEPSIPLRMWGYLEWVRGSLSKEGYLEILKSLENYLIRRYICGRRSHAGSEEIKVMPSLCGQSVQAIKTRLARTGYPSDEDFIDNLAVADIGSGELARYGRIVHKRLEETEALGDRKLIPLDPYNTTLEHVLPKTESPEWAVDLKSEYADMYKYRHTIGNTCLLSQAENGSCAQKLWKDKKRVYAITSHTSARALVRFDRWGLESMQEVAGLRVQILVHKVWPHLHPTLEKDAEEERKQRQLKHHEALTQRSLFEQSQTLAE